MALPPRNAAVAEGEPMPTPPDETMGGMQTGSSGPLTSFDGALIYKNQSSLNWNMRVSKTTTQSTISAFGTYVSNTASRAQLYHDGAGNVTGHFYNGTTWTQTSPVAVSLSGLNVGYLIWGVKAGPTGGAETLQMDYIRCMQDR